MSAPSAMQRFRGVFALTAMMLMACGPVQSTSYLIDAQTMLHAARTAEAMTLAPYEWTAANLYLEKSKEEAGYSDYEQAIDFGKKAVDFASRARDAALKSERRVISPIPEPVTP